MMRNLVLLFAVAVVAVTLGSIPANAQVPITVGNSGSGVTTFTAAGGGTLDMTVGSCIFGPSCWSGTNAFPPTTALFNFSGGAQVLTSLGSGEFSVSGPAIPFALFLGSSTLTGTLSLVDFDQFAAGLGQFNDNLTGNLSITGSTGVLAALFPSNQGEVTVSIDIAGGTNLTTLAGAGTGTATAGFSGAEIFPTPEPGSMLLLGTGLLSLGGAIRRRLPGQSR